MPADAPRPRPARPRPRRLRQIHLVLSLGAALVAGLVTSVAGGAPAAVASVEHHLGYEATVLGWTSWYGSYGLGALGDGWCIDHGLVAPDAGYGYVPVPPPTDERTAAALSWVVATGPLADRVGSAAVMLTLHDLMGATYPFGRLDVDRLVPANLAGFAGAEAAVLARARTLKAWGLAHAHLRAPYRIELEAEAVPPGTRGALRGRVVDRDGRGVADVPVALAATGALDATSTWTDGDGAFSTAAVAVSGANAFLARATVPDSVPRILAPTRASAQRIAQPALAEALGGTAFELPPPTTSTTAPPTTAPPTTTPPTTAPPTTTTTAPPTTTTTAPPATTTTTAAPPATTSTTTPPPSTTATEHHPTVDGAADHDDLDPAADRRPAAGLAAATTRRARPARDRRADRTVGSARGLVGAGRRRAGGGGPATGARAAAAREAGAVEMTRTHTFDAPIDEVWTMFRDREAHVAKFEAMGHREIEVLAYDGDDDHVRLEVRRVVDIEVPGFAKKVIRPSNTVTSIDDWTRHDDGTCTGTQVIHTPNPVDITSTTALRPADDGRTTYEITVAIKVNVPLIGGKVANFAKGDVEKQLRDEFACGDAWLTEHAG